MALDAKSWALMDYVTFDTIADYVAWCHLTLETVSLD